MEVGIRDLKNNLSRHLDKVKAGELIVITDRGKPIAKIEKIGRLSNFDRLRAEGRISEPLEPKIPGEEMPPPIDMGLKPGELQKFIDESRGRY